MMMRFTTLMCIAGVILAVAAGTLHMVNVGHFDWIAAGKSLGLCAVMLVAWLAARSKSLRQASPGAQSASPRGPAAGP